MPQKKPPPDKMTFLDHLDELRRRIIASVLTLVVTFALCFTFAQRIFDFLMQPLREALPEGGQLIATAVPEIFMLYLKMSFFAAIFVASPMILTQVWLFVAPGLYPKERHFAIPFIFLGTFFFLGGAAFGHYIVFPYAAHFLTTFGGESIEILLTVSAVFSFYSKFILGMGLVFEIPTLTFLLSRLGTRYPAIFVGQVQIRCPHHLCHCRYHYADSRRGHPELARVSDDRALHSLHRHRCGIWKKARNRIGGRQ